MHPQVCCLKPRRVASAGLALRSTWWTNRRHETLNVKNSMGPPSEGDSEALADYDDDDDDDDDVPTY